MSRINADPVIETIMQFNAKRTGRISTGRPRRTRAVSLRFPGNETSANPIRNSGTSPSLHQRPNHKQYKNQNPADDVPQQQPIPALQEPLPAC